MIGGKESGVFVRKHLEKLILELLKSHNIMSLATVRPDGFPQATSVVYANEGLTIYFACDPGSQKAMNIARIGKVSLTINHDYRDWTEIRGLSMGATAKILSRPADRRRAWRALAAKFPAMAESTEFERAEAAVVRVTPKVISVIDYRRGFGHTDLVKLGKEGAVQGAGAAGRVSSERSAGVRGVTRSRSKARQRSSRSAPPTRSTQARTRSSPRL